MNAKDGLKFTAAVAALFLVPFLILSKHFISGESELQRKDTLRYMELRTSAGASIVSDVLNLNYSLSRAAGGKAGQGAEALKRELSSRVKENPFIFSEAVLLGASGKELARYAADTSVKARVDYASSPALAEAKETLSPAGAVEYGEYTPPALVLVEPLLQGGKAAYFLAGRLSLAYLGEVVRMMGRNSHGNFGLVDVGGQVIADSRSLSIMKPGFEVPAEVSKALALARERESQTFSSEVYFRGRTLLVSVSNVGGSGWWIYEVMDSADLPARRASAWAWRVVLSGVLLILLFSVLVQKLAVRLFSRPE